MCAICAMLAAIAAVGCAGDAASDLDNRTGAGAVTDAREGDDSANRASVSGSDRLADARAGNQPETARVGALAVSGADVDSAVAAMQACPRDGRWHVCSVQSRFSQAGLRVIALDSALGIPGIDVETRAWRIGGQQLRLAFFASDADARSAMDLMDSARALPRGSSAPSWAARPTLLHNANVVGVLLGGTDRAIERASNALMAGPPQPPREEPM